MSVKESESRNIVFSPNKVVSPDFGRVYDSFMRKRGRWDGETCKKTAKPGDLYLLWFGEPVSKIAGLAVCSKSPDQEGQMIGKPGKRRKMFFCSMDAVYHCKTPVTLDDLRTSKVLAPWWYSKPYYGRPKTIPSEVSVELLQMIAKREPTVASFLKGYIGDCHVATNGPKLPDDQTSADEGTINERLVKQRLRSKALRDEKIRRSTDDQGHLVCEVPGCGFDFFEQYGALDRGFAHVHHLKPLAERKKKYRAKLKDLAIVCANCHAMIHIGRACRPLKGLISSR